MQHGLPVSRSPRPQSLALCLGTMMFGGETDEGTGERIIDKAFEHGVNFIDTANAYHAGRSVFSSRPHR